MRLADLVGRLQVGEREDDLRVVQAGRHLGRDTGGERIEQSVLVLFGASVSAHQIRRRSSPVSAFSQYPPACGLRSPRTVRWNAATRLPIDTADIPM